MPDDRKLQGRVALVTGAGKRLGRAVAVRLAEEGADVAIHYGKSASEAREVVEQIEKLDRRAVAFPAELTDVVAIQRLVNDVVAQFGHLDILINTAATFLQTKFGETTETIWQGSLDTNLKAPFFLSQAAAPYLRQSGHGVIINFADIGGLLGWRDFLPHSVSKAGVVMLTRILAKELAPVVRVNAIAPGTISMPGDPPEWETDYVRLAPLHRTGRPKDIADAVVYLITAEFMTGHVLVLDGGRTL
jgi:NAD(P)-dependent dehydrogenase (short-subunit alcohol dehydrogenase family)